MTAVVDGDSAVALAARSLPLPDSPTTMLRRSPSQGPHIVAVLSCAFLFALVFVCMRLAAHALVRVLSF